MLRDGDQVIGETSIIIGYVAGAQLVPSLEARKWDRLCDQYISDAVQAIVFDTLEACLLKLSTVDLTLRRYDTDVRRSDEHCGCEESLRSAFNSTFAVFGVESAGVTGSQGLRV